MYIPVHFNEDRIVVIHAAIRTAGLASLVTMTADGLIATPLPLMLDPEPAPYGTLIGHIARANPQWRTADPQVPALAIFSGPDAYVTPSWYATKRESGKVVPTWNYVAIHATGPVEFFTDPASLHALVSRLTDLHENQRAEPWAVTDAPASFVAAQLNGIVGLRLRITRLEGKWKMSQNRTAQDREGVVAGLRASAGPAAAAVADAVAAANA
jgi:transcriptional regulator